MTRGNDSVLAKLDWLTVGMFMLLVFFGWLSVCGADYSFEEVGLLDFASRSGKQLVWILCSFGVIMVILAFSQNFYRSYAYVFYGFMIALLIVTIFITRDIKGTHSMIRIGPVGIQPEEFAKAATAMALAKFLDDYGFNPRDMRNICISVGLFMLPTLIIILQKETGSALVFLSFLFVLYREGMSGQLLFSGFCAVLFFILGVKYWNLPCFSMPFNTGPFVVMLLIELFTSFMVWMNVQHRNVGWAVFFIGVGTTFLGLLVSLLVIPFNVVTLQVISVAVMAAYLLYQVFKNVIKECLVPTLFAVLATVYLFSCNFVLDSVLQPHQQKRVNIILGIEDDPYGAGYNVNQSMIAIGSGGFWGKGFLNGTQTKLKYVPEQYTDFIFCTVGEEQGFKGAAVVLLLFGALMLRLVKLAERQSSVFGRAYGYSVVSIFLFHLFINVGMVLGITPVIGIPLPFFSYGGSSLWGFTILLFIFLRIDAERTSRF